MYYAQHGMKTYHTSIRCRATERDGWNTLQHFRIRPYASRIYLQALAATQHATDPAFDRRFVTKTQGCLIRFTRGTWAAQRPACHWIRLLPCRHDIYKNCESHRAWYSMFLNTSFLEVFRSKNELQEGIYPQQPIYVPPPNHSFRSSWSS